jgi:hypothetical protein
MAVDVKPDPDGPMAGDGGGGCLGPVNGVKQEPPGLGPASGAAAAAGALGAALVRAAVGAAAEDVAAAHAGVAAAAAEMRSNRPGCEQGAAAACALAEEGPPHHLLRRSAMQCLLRLEVGKRAVSSKGTQRGVCMGSSPRPARHTPPAVLTRASSHGGRCLHVPDLAGLSHSTPFDVWLLGGHLDASSPAVRACVRLSGRGSTGRLVRTDTRRRGGHGGRQACVAGGACQAATHTARTGPPPSRHDVACPRSCERRGPLPPRRSRASSYPRFSTPRASLAPPRPLSRPCAPSSPSLPRSLTLRRQVHMALALLAAEPLPALRQAVMAEALALLSEPRTTLRSPRLAAHVAAQSVQSSLCNLSY